MANNLAFSTAIAALVKQLLNGTITEAAFATQYSAALSDWNGVTPTEVFNRVVENVDYQRVSYAQLRDWYTGPADGGPAGDGYYPLTTDAGATVMVPSLALFMNPVTGPAQQASNAAIRAENAANAATVTAAGITANTSMIAQNLAWAQANATISTVQAGISTSNAVAANLSKVAAGQSEANALTHRNAAQTAMTQAAANATTATTRATWATANATIAQTQAGIATGNATVAIAQATVATTQAGISTSNAVAANLSKVAAAASEANALTYRNTTLTYRDQTAANATIAVGNATLAVTAMGQAQANAVIATTQAGIATDGATTATAQATVATSAATTATTQAVIATSNAVSAAAANASAWQARANASTSETNALAYRNTTLTYRDQASANATISRNNAVAAAASSNTATTRAVAAETAQAAAEAAYALARNMANAAANSAVQAAQSVGFDITDYQPIASKGQPNGYASLDTNGKVPIAQLDTAVLGGLKYMGAWNASTNNPTIPAAALANKGQYYKVSTAGTTNVGGYTDWQVGDWALSDGTIWDKIDNTDQVQSVAGKTGAVTLTKADVGLSLVDNTPDSAKAISAATATALAGKLDTTAKATQTEAIVGADDTKYMTPAKTSAAISNAIAGRQQFSNEVVATGSSQTVNLGQDIQPGELLIFVNGVEQATRDFTKSGTNWTFTRPAGSVVRFMLPGGVRGQSFDPDATGTTAGRSSYDGQPVGFCYLAADTGTFSWRMGNAGSWTGNVTLTGPQGPIGNTGNAGVNGSNGVNGWSPVMSLVADGARYVAKVTDWTGGTTGKPTANVFVTSTGFTANVALATDIRGPQGVQGIQGNAGVNGTNGANGVSAVYSTVTPQGLASANAVGVASVAAREDHVHQFPLARITQTPTAAATLALTDHGGVVEWNASANAALTLPNNLPQGFNCLVRVVSATTVPTFTAASGAVIRQADAFTKARRQWSEVSVSVRANANGSVAEYVLSGDMA